MTSLSASLRALFDMSFSDNPFSIDNEDFTDCPGSGKSSTFNLLLSARMKALSLYLIRSIVEKHGGTIDIDLSTDTININVPEKEQVACAQEIEEQVGSMC